MITIDGGTGLILHNGVEIASDKMVDHWRLSADVDPDDNTSYYVSTNWERVDTDGSVGNYFGTGMTESSGEFTFPKTGIYHIHVTGVFYGNSHSANVYIATTTDGSSYSDAAVGLDRVATNSTGTLKGTAIRHSVAKTKSGVTAASEVYSETMAFRTAYAGQEADSPAINEASGDANRAA